MTSTAAASPSGPSAEVRALQVLVALFLAIRLWTQLTSGIVGDEAYYWMWGQHPALSYFDHPPLHAWLLGLVSLVSWHPFAVRALTWVSLALIAFIFWAWSKRLAPEAPQLWFWRAAAIYLASPLFFVLTGVAYNDHLLAALCIAAIHCFAMFVERAEAETSGANRWLFGAAALLGLAVLTKYNAVFVGLGFAATFLVRPKLRPLLLTPVPWLAAALAVTMQAPVLWWNFAEGGASFRFHLSDRWGNGDAGLHWINLIRFAGLSLVLWSPFLIWPLIRMARARPDTAFADALLSPVLWTLGISTLALLFIALVRDAYFYWNIVALVAVTPLLAAFANKWLRLLHYIFGLLLAVAALIQFSIIPIAFLTGGRDYASAINYDWDVVAQHIRTEADERPDALLAATRFTTAAQLGLALGTSEVVKLSPEVSQFDFWQDDQDLAGKPALILVDEPDNSPRIRYLRARFASLEEVDRFEIERFGRPIYSWRILLGEGWTP